MRRRKECTVTTSMLKDVERAHQRLDRASDVVRDAVNVANDTAGATQDLGRKQTILAEALRQTQQKVADHAADGRGFDARLSDLEDATHAHPTEGDSALEERLAALELAQAAEASVRRDITARVFALESAGNTTTMGRDYLNENWPAERADADLPVRPCGSTTPHDAHKWGTPISVNDDTWLYCPGYPDDEPDTDQPADPETLAAGDENKITPLYPDDPAPTAQQRRWLASLLAFHKAGGTRVTAFEGGPASGKTWLMRQLEARDYPVEGGLWHAWAERWATTPDPRATMSAELAITNPLGDDQHWVHRHFRRTVPTTAQRAFLLPQTQVREMTTQEMIEDAASLRQALCGEQRAHEATITDLVRMRKRAVRAEGDAEEHLRELARIRRQATMNHFTPGGLRQWIIDNVGRRLAAAGKPDLTGYERGA